MLSFKLQFAGIHLDHGIGREVAQISVWNKKDQQIASVMLAPLHESMTREYNAPLVGYLANSSIALIKLKIAEQKPGAFFRPNEMPSQLSITRYEGGVLYRKSQGWHSAAGWYRLCASWIKEAKELGHI